MIARSLLNTLTENPTNH
uniref:Uncharacterized protein n=1 Tax=Arundo donax TaxID=35708 RepID=A0A0A8XWP5_ARUDO